MSNISYGLPTPFTVAGYTMDKNYNVDGQFTMSFNVRSAVEAVEQAEYIYKDRNIRVILVQKGS